MAVNDDINEIIVNIFFVIFSGNDTKTVKRYGIK